MSRPRIDPREARKNATGPAGRLRVRPQSPPMRPQRAETRDLPLRSVTNPTGTILVLIEAESKTLTDHNLDVIGAARLTAEPISHTVSLAAFGGSPDTRWDLAGADHVILIPRKDSTDYTPEADTLVAIELVNSLAPSMVLVPDSMPGMGDVGRRLAVELARPLASSVHSIDGSFITASADGGASDVGVSDAFILLLEPECAPQVAGARYPATVEFYTGSLERSAPTQVADEGLLPCDLTHIPLRESEFIISAGNGVDNWRDFQTLASVLNGTIGCTRPVCDQGIFPKSRQIGVTGELVKSKCYLAFGVSGAHQHLQGIAKCRCVIAVNKNPHADIMRRADLAIVADAQDVIPALIRRVAYMEGDSP